MAETKIIDIFGKKITEIIGSDSSRMARQKTGISPAYILDMAKGVVPSEGIVRKFAEGYCLTSDQTSELLAIAGYQKPRTYVEAIGNALITSTDATEGDREAIMRFVEKHYRKSHSTK